MSPDQLREFDAACRKSMRAADAWLDAFLKDKDPQYGGIAVKGGGKRVYMVPRHGADVTGGSPEMVIPTLTDMLKKVDIGRELRKLRKEHERFAPAADRVPSAPWVVEVENSTERLDPDEEALVCLRLLSRSLSTSSLRHFTWLNELVAKRLTALLVEYPVLMHPRLLWDTSHVKVDAKAQGAVFAGEPLPMLHTIIWNNTGRRGLPSEYRGITGRDLLNFDRHPAVAAGIRARAPFPIETFELKSPNRFKKTIGELMFDFKSGFPDFMATLLRIERNRLEAMSPSARDSGLFEGSGGMSNGIRYALGNAFTQCFTRPGDMQPRLALMDELARSTTRNARSNLEGLLSDASRIFWDEGTLSAKRAAGPSGNVKLGQPFPASNSADRFEWLTDSLISAGAATSKLEAVRTVLPALFPQNGDVFKYSSGVEHVTTEMAFGFFRRCTELGVTFEELTRRMRGSNRFAGGFSQAYEVLEREHQMLAVLRPAQAPAAEATATAEVAAEPTPPAPARRLRGGGL